VQGGLYAVPAVRCPVCNKRLATATWSSLVGEQTLTKYRENARALLTYRCAACDETSSYFSATGVSRDPFAVLAPEVCERLGEAWRRFFLAESSAEDFLQVILEEHSCGHRSCGTPPARLSKIFGSSGSALWISDLERRLAVQLAWMQRFPRQRTPCCGERFCFRCKVSSWHRGISCQERLQTEKARQAQLCPGCGVPTQRSEGCRKMTCVCGRVWEWEGDESSEEGTFDDDGSDGENVAQAQTAVNLVAMNSRAGEASVHEVVQALIEARADVNPSTGPAAEAQAPLLVAVQNRHPAAAAVLCEHGARVTPEVLEEVKLISRDAHRCRIEEVLRPQIQGDPNMKLPLWAWVQAGSAAAVEALLRNASHDEVVGVDALVALHRSSGGEESRRRMAERVREHLGDGRFRELSVSAATRGLLLELRQALDEEREVELQVVREMLALRADVNAREEADEDDDEAEGAYGLTPLNLLAMNARANAESVEGSVRALMEASADVNAETDEAGTPLLTALQHRNIAAVAELCKGPVKFVPEILDELKTLSESSRRHQLEELLCPIIRGDTSRRLPLWIWVQEGTAPAVEALLQRKEQVDEDALVALQRCRGDEESRGQIEGLLRQHLGDRDYSRLQAAAATRRLLQELREAYDDERDVCLGTVQETLSQGADANTQEEEPEGFEDGVGSFGFTALQLLVTNTHASKESMLKAVASLVEAKADVNLDDGDTPLVSAVQHRCVAGVEALSLHSVKVTAEVLEELKSVSGTKARNQIEDILQPLIDRDKSLRCPLWLWVQVGSIPAVEALLRNSAHDEEVDADALVALQRCRGGEEAKQQIADRLREHVGEEEFKRLEAVAATRRLLLELREAHGEERDPELDVVRDALAHGANPNAREEEEDEDGVEEDDPEEEDQEEDEEEPEDDDEADGDDEDGTEWRGRRTWRPRRRDEDDEDESTGSASLAALHEGDLNYDDEDEEDEPEEER